MRKEQFEKAFKNNLNLKDREKFSFQSKCSMRRNGDNSMLIQQVVNFYYHLAKNLLKENNNNLNILYVGDRDFCCTYLALIVGFLSADTEKRFSYIFVGDFCKKVLEGNNFDLSNATFVSSMDDVSKDEKFDVVYGNMCGAMYDKKICEIYESFVEYINENALIIFSCLGFLDIWGCALATGLLKKHWFNIYKYFCSHNMHVLSDVIFIYDKTGKILYDGNKSEKILVEQDGDNIKFDKNGQVITTHNKCFCLAIDNDFMY